MISLSGLTILLIVLSCGVDPQVVAAKSPDCAIGPVYACQSVANFRNCESFGECLSYWRSTVQYFDDSENANFNCRMCENLLLDVKNQNIPMDQLPSFPVQQLRRLLPKYLSTNLFSNIFKENTFELGEMLKANLSESLICQVLQYCPTFNFLPPSIHAFLRLRLQQPPQSQLVKDSSQECLDCMHFIEDSFEMDSRIISSWENSTSTFLCQNLPPSVQNLCIYAFESYIELLVIMTKQVGGAPVTCFHFGFCHYNATEIMRMGFAHFVTTTTLKQSRSRHYQLSWLCRDWMTTVGDRLWNILAASPQLSRGNSTTLPEKQFCASLESIGDLPTCELCKVIIHLIEKQLPMNRTEVVIEKALEEACYLIPTENAREQCVDMMDKYGKAIVVFLLENASAQLICSSLGLCIVP